MRIGITYNLKSDIENIAPQNLLAEDAFEEFDTEETIDAIISVLEKNSHSVVRLGWGRKALSALLLQDVDFVFNISEGFIGRNREAQIPAVLEMLEIPYSGSDPLTLSLTLDKIRAKEVLRQNNITTPDYFVINGVGAGPCACPDISLPARIKFPLFLKPAWEGSSKGIRHEAKVATKKDLASYARYLLTNYPGQPVLAEEYIAGQEFTAAVLGNANPEVLGIMKISPKIKALRDFFYSIEVKRDWENLVSYECPADINIGLKSELERMAVAAFKAFGCMDVARVDFRVDNSGEPYFIEINPLPGLSPRYSDIVIMAKKLDWAYDKLITTILNNALSRYRTDISCEKI